MQVSAARLRPARGARKRMLCTTNKDRDFRVAITFRPARHVGVHDGPSTPGFQHLIEAFAQLNVAADIIAYEDDAAAGVLRQFECYDGVLVWVDPVSESGHDRRQLDDILEQLAERGIWISAHPEVIRKLGVKEVLFTTRELGWSPDTHLYRTAEQFRREFPRSLWLTTERVLKENCSNWGLGVWKIELHEPWTTAIDGTARIRVLRASEDTGGETMRLAVLLDRFEAYLNSGGFLVDQPFNPRVADGIIRCYLVQNAVVGFGYQLVRAFSPKRSQDGPREMSDASNPKFQGLRRLMETMWLPAMLGKLDMQWTSLPAIWDADFLYGPPLESGLSTYMLCEINASSVFPYPVNAATAMARAAVHALMSAKARRRQE
jgi:hypothetical protein